MSDSTVIKFHIWDTGGAEKFRALQPLYYRDAQAAVITYSVANRESFEALTFWIEELHKHNAREDVIVCVVGNKSDISKRNREVDEDEAHRFVRKYNAYHAEVSAKTGDMVTPLFRYIAKRVHQIKNEANSVKSAERASHLDKTH